MTAKMRVLSKKKVRELVLYSPAHIDRMPVIIAPADYGSWLSPDEPDPRDLLRPT